MRMVEPRTYECRVGLPGLLASIGLRSRKQMRTIKATDADAAVTRVYTESPEELRFAEVNTETYFVGRYASGSIFDNRLATQGLSYGDFEVHYLADGSVLASRFQ